jgi:sulfur-carrier protein adenylyltransferase/sulfurtransferase
MSQNPEEVKEIDVQELKKWRDTGKDFDLIDVREPNEYDLTHIGGTLIPLGQISNRAGEVSKERTVVVMCRSGKRSSQAVLELQKNLGYSNLLNLKGGILAWSAEIDSNIPRY